MNKADLAESILQFANSKKEAKEIVEALLDSIKKSLKKKDPVAISGFGTFKVKQTKARQGRNPKTGETIQIPAKKKVAFRASKELKELV
ncbi:MAG: HU family DNA-binding protein [Candidatus Omnitrophica bacterium]|nr:HU family DNA-binding protein [Candidatus Omnitrophota bacterium]